MPDVLDVLQRNAKKRADNIKSTGREEKRAVETLIDDLKDLEVVEGPLKLGSNSTSNLGRHLQKYADSNKELFDGLERSVIGSDFSLRDKLGGR